VLDESYLVVHFSDGDVTFENDKQVVTRYEPALDTRAAGEVGSRSIRRSKDIGGEQKLDHLANERLGAGSALRKVGASGVPQRGP
jgi:hypothetical protein